jgi:hypothetical protein
VAQQEPPVQQEPQEVTEALVNHQLSGLTLLPLAEVVGVVVQSQQ